MVRWWVEYDDYVWHHADDLRLLRVTGGPDRHAPQHIWLFAHVWRHVDGPRVGYTYVLCPDPAWALEILERQEPGNWVAWMHIAASYGGVFKAWSPPPTNLDGAMFLERVGRLLLPKTDPKPLHPGRKGNWTGDEIVAHWKEWLAWHEKYEPDNAKQIIKAKQELGLLPVAKRLAAWLFSVGAALSALDYL